MNRLKYQITVYYILLILITLLLWFYNFPLDSFEYNDIIIEGLYLISALISFYFVWKLDITSLYLGWGLFVYGLFIDFLDEFTEEPDLFDTYLEGFFTIMGLILIASGFYLFVVNKKKLEENSEVNNKDYETILKNTQDAIFLLDVSENGITYNRLNPTHERLTGLSTEEVRGKSPLEVFDETLGNRIMINYQRCLEEKEVITYNEELELPGGNRVWHTKLNPVLNRENEVVQIVGSSRDITRQNKIENILKQSEKKYKQLFEEAPIGLIKCDVEGNILNVNKQMVKMLGSPGEKATMGLNILELPGLKGVNKEVGASLQKNIATSGEIYYESIWGKEIWIEYNIKLLNDNNDVEEIIISCNDITEKKEAEEKMKYLSFHDQMTGLYNRRYFENELHRLSESRKLPISIVIGDLDGLKNINDNYGHKKGDEYIKIAGNILKTITRDEDIVARIGGDEFAIILTETDSEIAQNFCKRIVEKYDQYNRDNNLNPPISISAGYATKNGNNRVALEEIFVQADKNMYQEKNRKHNQ